jgi:hypothetical protein
MPLSRRYHPEIAPGEESIFGMDFSPLIPVGVGIQSGTLHVTRIGGEVTGITHGEVSWYDRTLYATVTADPTSSGFDYELTWTATDTDGNIFPRTARLLCAPTS